jgi:N-acyl amino acid synthase of PEP-CTERM/exosortase system
MILDMLRSGPKRDPLTPYFTFTQLMRDRLESALFKEILRLRYEVYCLECHYLDAREYDEGLETDSYDIRSYHVGAHNLEGLLVGTVRLVFASEAEVFPFEEHCKVFDDFDFPPRAQCAEVSRLVVRKDFRRRPGDSLQGVSKEFQEKGKVEDISPLKEHKPGPHRRSSSPQILLGMYREMYRHSRKAGIRYWFAAMEKGLARSLGKMGFHFVAVGPEGDYYGPVAAYVVDLWELHDNLRHANEFLACWFNDEPISLWLMAKTWIHFKFVAKEKI